MEFQILGPLRVLREGEEVDIGPRKQRALLAVLLLSPGRVVTTDGLLDALWGDDAVGKENALWVYISRLRALLEPDRDPKGSESILETHDHGYSLRLDGHDLDSLRFGELATEGTRLVGRDPSSAVTVLDDALKIWNGELLEDFLHDEFTQAERRRFAEERLDAFEELTEARLGTGRSGELVTELESAVGDHPNRERLVRQLMLALYRSGRTVDALRSFDRHRRMLAEELGLEPSPELKRLEEQILLHDSRLLRRGRSADAGLSAPGENPFKGLRSFDESDDGVFYGRDQAVSEVVKRLDSGDRLLTLVGSSGSGKSSIVRAGVVPALRKGAIESSDGWLIAQMVPGAHPFAELEAALIRSTLDAPDSLRDQLDDGEMGLMRAALRVLPTDSSTLVLVIDQFEELFTTVENEEVRSRFLDCFSAALDDPRGRVRIVLTLRADFYDRPLAYPDFATRMSSGVLNVVPLTPNQLEAAANEPAKQAGVALEPALLATLIADVIGQPGGLPLFQYALTDLFDRRSGDELTLADYDEMGGVRGALSSRADDLYAGLSDDEQRVARQLFLRLVTIADGNQSVRRRVPASELVDLGNDSVVTNAAIDTFGRHRLLSFDLDAVTGSPTLEVAHEALLTEWGLLDGWIDEARDDLRRRSALSVSIDEWTASEKNPDYLLSGARLDSYVQWSESSLMALTLTETAFVQQSLDRRDELGRAETERAAVVQAESKRAGRRLWALAAALGAVLAAIVGFFLFTGEDALPRVGFVTVGYENTGDIYDQVANGIEASIRDLDIDGQALEPKSDFDDEVTALIESSPDLVVLGYLEFDAPVPGSEYIEEYPDTHFLLIADNDVPPAPNSTVAIYAENEASFLVGAAAALESKTGTIGFIGALPRVIDSFQAGYVAGARHVDPDIEVLTHTLIAPLSTAFRTPSLGVEASGRLYRLGADVVYTAAGVTGNGVHETAARLSDELGTQLWSIGVDIDAWLSASPEVRDHLLTSALKRHDSAVIEMVGAFVDGTLEPGTFELNLANSGVGYATSGDHLSASTIDRLEVLRLGIVNGDIEVPFFTNETAAIHPDEDVVVTMSFDGNECSVSSPDLTFGDIVRLELSNQSSLVVAFGLTQYRDDLDFFDILTVSDVQPGLTKTVYARVTHDLDVSADCFDGIDTWLSQTLELTPPDDPDRVVAITFDGQTCAADLDFEAINGEVVQYLLWNGTSESVGFGVTRMEEGTELEDLQGVAPDDLPVLDPPDLIEFGVPANEVVTIHTRLEFEGRRFVGCWVGDDWNVAGTFDVVAS